VESEAKKWDLLPRVYADISRRTFDKWSPSASLLVACIRKHVYLGYVVSVKGKAIPLQAWTGPEGSRRLRLLDFKTIGT